MKQVQCAVALAQRSAPRIGATEPVSKFDPESREHPVLRRQLRPASAPCRFRVWGLHSSAAHTGRWLMELLYPRCAGLDVHARTVVACARIASAGTVTYHQRTVATTTQGLLEFADWLTARGCTHVAMESTGVYWKPVWHMLDQGQPRGGERV